MSEVPKDVVEVEPTHSMKGGEVGKKAQQVGGKKRKQNKTQKQKR